MKKYQMDILKMNVQDNEADIKRYVSEKLADILEKANTLLNKYYIYYDSFFNLFEVCYCNDVTITYNGIGIDYRFVEIAATVNVRYCEKSTTTITSMEFFDSLVILNEEQAKEIYDEINKTICGEWSLKDLHGFLKGVYNTSRMLEKPIQNTKTYKYVVRYNDGWDDDFNFLASFNTKKEAQDFIAEREMWKQKFKDEFGVSYDSLSGNDFTDAMELWLKEFDSTNENFEEYKYIIKKV